MRMRHKQYKFRCDRSIIKGTLLKEQTTFYSRITTSIREIYLKLQTHYLLHMRHKQYKFRCDRFIIKDTLLEEQITFSPYHDFY